MRQGIKLVWKLSTERIEYAVRDPLDSRVEKMGLKPQQPNIASGHVRLGLSQQGIETKPYGSLPSENKPVHKK
jgi:hypothetical protein